MIGEQAEALLSETLEPLALGDFFNVLGKACLDDDLTTFHVVMLLHLRNFFVAACL